MKNKNNNSDLMQGKFVPILLASMIIIVWLSSGIILYKIEDRGTFGDMFGSINALFSGLAFGGVIYAILLQRKELALQREELALTRKELSRSAQAQELSEKALKKQAESFEISSKISAIDSLLDVYSKELNSYAGQTYSGAKAQEVQKRKLYLQEQRNLLHQGLEKLYAKVADV